MMSVTGVVLTYERQVQVWEDRSYYAEPGAGQQVMTADQLIAASRSLEGFEPTSLILNSDPTAPAVLRQGRSQTQYLNPYSGQPTIRTPMPGVPSSPQCAAGTAGST